MQCSVDVTESVVELQRVWCRYAVIPLTGSSRRSAGRWRPWACLATDYKIFLFNNRFSQFLLQKIQQYAVYNHTKKDFYNV